ncbi:serine--tRNA ligase [Myxococcota bacterium]|nr:serine--tRNA ligase [Myxococcota bacterium]MCZ7617105.1 serine--tRNA ligase [Myxococcota bacterium]
MLDPRTLAERRDEVAASVRRRGMTADVDSAVAAYQEAARLRTAVGEVNRLRNEHQKSGSRKLAPAEREAHADEGRRLKDDVVRLEAELAAAEDRLHATLRLLPNLLHPDVPDGGEDDARELRRWGEPRRFDFPPLDHVELGRRLDLLDFEAGTRVAGPKFYFLKHEAVLLDLALQRLALELLRGEGFELVTTPDLAKAEIVDSLGYNPRGPETQIYSIADSDLCLIGTAEIPLGGLFAGETLEEAVLPVKLAGLSHCFRTEAGSYGRESKGLYRVHQFSKVEMFVATRPEDSDAMHEQLLALEERYFQALELPYRVLDIAAGDLGAPAYRKFDLEAWMPGRGDGGSYGEVTSASNCTDYQARRLDARFRRAGAKRSEHLHLLNGTAVATSRALIAVLENHQRADGGIAVPEVLVPFTGIDRIDPR